MAALLDLAPASFRGACFLVPGDREKAATRWLLVTPGQFRAIQC